MTQDMDLVRHWARRYYDMGLNCIPSFKKRPAMKSADFRRVRENRIPEEWIGRWWSDSIQIVLGVRWKLCVVDIDGNKAFCHWKDMGPPVPRATWISSSSRGSRHVWFRTLSCHHFPTRVLWKGEGKHEEIKLLADGALVVAPPSIHHGKGTRYEWLVGPDDLPEPAPLPGWLLDRYPSAASSQRPSRPRPQRLPLPSGSGPWHGHYQRDEVLYGLGNHKLDLLARYGFQFKRFPNFNGFHDCRAVDREDNDWSCTIDPITGVYRDWATNERLSFFDVLMRLDPREFPDFPTTVNKLGHYLFQGGHRVPG